MPKAPADLISGHDVRQFGVDTMAMAERAHSVFVSGLEDGKRRAGDTSTFVLFCRENQPGPIRCEVDTYGLEYAVLAWVYREGFVSGWWEATQ